MYYRFSFSIVRYPFWHCCLLFLVFQQINLNYCQSSLHPEREMCRNVCAVENNRNIRKTTYADCIKFICRYGRAGRVTPKQAYCDLGYRQPGEKVKPLSERNMRIWGSKWIMSYNLSAGRCGSLIFCSPFAGTSPNASQLLSSAPSWDHMEANTHTCPCPYPDTLLYIRRLPFQFFLAF